MTAVLLVGGPSDVRRQLEAKLEPHDVRIVDQWEYRKAYTGKTIPASVNAVVLLTDMTDHGLAGYVIAQAKSRDIPVARITRKWSMSKKKLRDMQILGKPSGAGDKDDGVMVDLTDIERRLAKDSRSGGMVVCQECRRNPCHCRMKETTKAMLLVADGVGPFVLETNNKKEEVAVAEVKVVASDNPAKPEPVREIMRKGDKQGNAVRRKTAIAVWQERPELSVKEVQEVLVRRYGIGLTSSVLGDLRAATLGKQQIRRPHRRPHHAGDSCPPETEAAIAMLKEAMLKENVLDVRATVHTRGQQRTVKVVWEGEVAVPTTVKGQL